MRNRVNVLRHGFMLSASFPMAALFAMPAQAQEVVTIDAPTTVAVANAKINTAVPAEPDLKVTVTTAGQITGPGTVFVVSNAGNGDGVVSFTNAGKLGAVDAAGAVTDSVGLTMFGAGATKAGNTATLASSGLITGGVNVTNYGGAVSVSNSGKIYGGLSANGFSAVTVETTKGSSVASGGIAASGTTSSTSKVDGDFTTTKTTGGNVKIVSAGDVVSVDGTTKGAVSGTGVADVSVSVDGVAGAVSATSNPTFTTVTQKALLPVADKTVVTGQSTSTRNGGAVATTTIGANGKVATATAVGNDSATAMVAGSVDGSVSASWFNVQNTTSKSTVTQNAAGVTTMQSAESTNFAAGGDSKAVIADTGTIGGSVSVLGQKSAAADIAGAVKGTVAASTTGAPANSTASSVQAYTDKGVIQSNTVKTTSTPSSGTATVTVASTGKIDGGVSAAGVGGSTISVAGLVKGGAAATSTGNAAEGVSVTTYDAKGAFATFQTTTTNKAAGNLASVTVSKGGSVLGAVSANGDGGAKIVNGGIIGDDTAPTSVIATSQRTITLLSTSGSTTTSDATSTTNTSNKKTVSGAAGSTASVTNEAGGLINGPVTVTGTAGATVSNAGVVRGTTSLNSGGFTSTSESSSSNKSTAVAGPPATTIFADKSASSASSVAAGGSVTGNYSGVNGALNFGTVNGSIFQSAHKDSTATVSGTVYGGVQSIAGNATSTNSSSSSDVTTTVDAVTTGTLTGTLASTSGSTSASGTSTVTVSGLVAGGAGASPDVFSQGTAGSIVSVTGKVEGFTQSNAIGVTATADDSVTAGAQTFTTGTPATDTLNTTTNSKTTVTGGSGKLDIGATGLATTGAAVGGVSDAAATVAAGGKIGNTGNNGSLTVAAGGTDSTSNTVQTYSRNTKTGVVTAQQVVTTSSGASTASGNASATVSGTVFGTTNVNAARGNATAVINGVSEDGVNVTAAGTTFSSKTTTNYLGKAAASPGTSFVALALPTVTDVTTSSTTTNVGGKATATISTAADLASKGTVGVIGAVNANGVGGATVGVTAGSKVTGSVFAGSVYFNNASETKQVNGTTAQTLTTSSANTLVGGTASVTNAGVVTGTAGASSVTAAEVTNSGKIGTVGGTAVFADALNSVTSTVTTDNDALNANPATRTTVSTATTSAVGGIATVTNAAGGVLQGNVFVSGKTGTVTNSGTIVGTTVLGEGVADYTVATTKVASGTTQVVTPSVTRFVQTYTANQNGLSGGFQVTGATVANPDPSITTPLQTSTVNATINLNSGSTTLGNVTGQQSATGARLTNTTLNLNGSGFLGADVLQLTPATAGQQGRTPLLTGLSTDQLAYLGFSTATGAVGSYAGGNAAVRILGIETVNKTGAGTFVIYGAQYVAPAGAGALPTWTMDVGNFNVTGGEVQLGVVPGTNSQFGINGNVTNSASLVLGRRVPATLRVIGDSLVGDGERIAGISIRQTGNFTQAAAGTTVVGITPSLVRFGQVSVGTSGGASEPLGPVNSGVNIPYFTTAANAGIAPANSRVDLTGNLSLAGNVLVNVSRDSLFVNNEGYTLFTYTGTGAVTATATSTLASPFVKFSLVHDATAKTVRVQAARSSYTSGATNPNAVAAAAALDSALPQIVTAITTDAAGGAGYTSVSQIGRAQDLANIASALDFRLSTSQIAQVFDEISSAEIYGSLSAVNQNAVWGDTVNQLATRRGVGETLGSQLWISPVGNFAEFGGTESGASEIKADTYGAAGGFDFAYLPDGVVGIGAAYAEHKVNAQGTAEAASGRTWTVGAYATQGFGKFYANASIAYGFTTFNVTRTLNLLARTTGAVFDATQFDGMLELGYDFDLGGALITPFAKAAFRSQNFDAFAEQNGGGVGVAVAKHSHSTFLPSLGFKVAGVIGDPEGISARPFVKASYTFQDDIGSDRTMTLLGGGNAFTLNGVNPEGYGTIEAGVDGSLGGRVRLFAGGGYSFGGDNSVANIRAGLGFRF